MHLYNIFSLYYACLEFSLNFQTKTQKIYNKCARQNYLFLVSDFSNFTPALNPF